MFNRNFPYYTFSRGREDLVLPSLRRDQPLRVIPKIMEVVQMQTRVIHQECASVQPDTTPLIEDMQNRVTAANALLEVCGLRETFDSEDMQAVLTLTTSSIQKYPQHSILNCEKFGHIDSNYMFSAPHGHKSHVTCFGNYLESLHLTFPAKIMCPLCPGRHLFDCWAS